MSTVLLGLAIFVIVAVWASAAVVLILRLLGRLETNTADTEFSLAMVRLNRDLRKLQVTIAEAMTPALVSATEAINNMMRAFGRSSK